MDPVKLQVVSHGEMEIEKDGMHLTLPRGMHEFLVSAAELKSIKEPVFRLRNAYNVRVENKDGFALEGKFAGKDISGKQVVSWISEMMDLELVLADGKHEVGVIEAMELHKGMHLYLEKKGFCIVDSLDGKRPVAYFTHE